VVDGAALEKRCAKAPRVRIPPSPPELIARAGRRHAGRFRSLGERSPSGLWRRTGNAVRGNPSRVRIPPSPPNPRADGLAELLLGPKASRSSASDLGERAPLGAEVASSTVGDRTVKASLLDCPGRARRGTSGALNLQSAPAGLNSHPRTASLQAAASSDVEDRVPRSDEPRTVSGPEGSSTKRSSSGAAERPGPSRSSWRA
jgi:hypothetical protein